MAQNLPQNDLELGSLGNSPGNVSKRRKFGLRRISRPVFNSSDVPTGELLKSIAGRDIDLSAQETLYMADRLRTF